MICNVLSIDNTGSLDNLTAKIISNLWFKWVKSQIFCMKISDNINSVSNKDMSVEKNSGSTKN